VRTTLSLDDDVASLLEKEVRRSGSSFKAVVNRLLRLGLVAAKEQQKTPQQFVVTPRRMGLPQGESYDDVERLLEVLEGSRHS
jgi:hypothetical protein